MFVRRFWMQCLAQEGLCCCLEQQPVLEGGFLILQLSPLLDFLQRKMHLLIGWDGSRQWEFYFVILVNVPRDQERVYQAGGQVSQKWCSLLSEKCHGGVHVCSAAAGPHARDLDPGLCRMVTLNGRHTPASVYFPPSACGSRRTCTAQKSPVNLAGGTSGPEGSQESVHSDVYGEAQTTEVTLSRSRWRVAGFYCLWADMFSFHGNQ